MKVLNYKAVFEDRYDLLENAVNKLLSKGYTLHGNTSMCYQDGGGKWDSGVVYFQAMVLLHDYDITVCTDTPEAIDYMLQQ
jgi:hypothetical protein